MDMFYVAHTYEAVYTIQIFYAALKPPIEMLKQKFEVAFHASILYAAQKLYGVAYYIAMLNVAQKLYLIDLDIKIFIMTQAFSGSLASWNNSCNTNNELIYYSEKFHVTQKLDKVMYHA